MCTAIEIMSGMLHQVSKGRVLSFSDSLLDVHFVNPVPVDCEDNNM